MTSRWLALGAGVTATAVAARTYATVTWPACLLGWVAFVPWLLACDRDQTRRDAWRSGIVMAVGFTLSVFDWFAGAVHSYTGYPRWAMLLVLAIAAPLLQPQFVIYSLVRQRLGGARGWRVAGLGGAYVGAEWAFGKLLGDTWGHGQYASPLVRQAADLGGAAGLSFALLSVNEAISGVVRRRRAGEPVGRLVIGIVLVVGGLHLYGRFRLDQIDRPAAPLAIASLVQASLGDYGSLRAERGTYDAVRLVLDTHFALSRQALADAPADFVVWPETVYPTTFGTPKSPAGADLDRDLVDFVKTLDRPLVFGSYDAAAGAEYNAAVLLTPSADPLATRATYRKTELFPLVERVPAWLDGAWLRRALPWLGTWTPGDGPTVLPLPRHGRGTIRIAPMICYDAVSPAHAIAATRAGAEAFVTLSNDNWFGESEGAHLHFVVSAFRSIETRRAQVRATNSGISAIITPTGAVEAFADVGERTTLTGPVAAPAPGETLMVRLGDWVGPTGAALAAAALLL
mgnify:CR=1 FL=1